MPLLTSVSVSVIVQGDQVVATFDESLPLGLEVVNQSFGDTNLAFTLPTADSVSFAVSDNAIPDDNIIISFRDNGVEFDSITLPFALASEWVGSVEVTGALGEIDDEIAAGDVVAWNNANFDLDPAGPNFFWVGSGDPAETETLDYFTIDASDNASFSSPASITFNRGAIQMTFPVVESRTPTPTTDTTPTSWTVDMPATVSAGDRLFFVLSTQTDLPSYITPTGWTKVAEQNSDAFVSAVLFTKISDGTEGGTTVTVTQSTSLAGN